MFGASLSFLCSPVNALGPAVFEDRTGAAAAASWPPVADVKQRALCVRHAVALHALLDPAASLHDVVAVVRDGLAGDYARGTTTVVVPVGTAASGVAVAVGNAVEVSDRMGTA